MISMNQVQILGKVTFEARTRELKNGNKVATLGLGIPEHIHKKNGDWETRMHFVDVTGWDRLAEQLGKRRKGEGLLILGSLQYESWEGKDGKKQSKVKVKAQRVQEIPWPEKQEGQRESTAS